MTRYARQKGTATILFAILIPALFGMFVLGIDGVKALQDKARLLDATEAASLAVSARTVDVDDSTDLELAETLVNEYLLEYMRDIVKIESTNIIKKHCDQIPECLANLQQGGHRYFQYQVIAQTQHQPWFIGGLQTLPETYSVAGRSFVNKYQNRAIDVAFIADFSGSMQDEWTGGSKEKYQDLFDVVSEVMAELQKYNDLEADDTNHVAFIPYNRYTSPAEETFSYPKDGKSGNDEEMRRCYMSYVVPNGSSTITISNATKTANNWDEPNYFRQIELGKDDFKDTAGGCRLNYESISSSSSKTNYQNLYLKSKFWDIPFTDNFKQVEGTIRTFDPWYGTSSYQGLIRAARLFKERVDANKANDQRLLIILSDGQDNYPTTMTRLNDAGLCDEIRGALSDPQKEIEAKIALIGFDYKVDSTNPGLRACVGEDNVYKANNRDEILNTILELITEEIGRLSPST
ncbi:TadE/TadG family type IV pilus assembly protein [Ferrimonas pelagia]|uniref:Pilus assembly protein n=1 Tax=Ferrimonas pelagia TaxID=1177826 RepID=A0ABP9FHI1_9GAMM